MNIHTWIATSILIGFANSAHATMMTLALEDVGTMGAPTGEFSGFNAGELFSLTYEIDDATSNSLTSSNVGSFTGGTVTIVGADSGASVTLASDTTRILAQDISPTLNRIRFESVYPAVAGTPQFLGGGEGLVLEYNYQILSDPLDLTQVLTDIDGATPTIIHGAQFVTSAGIMEVFTDTLSTPSVSAASVPEPAPFALLAVGLAGLAFSRRRKGGIRQPTPGFY